MLAKQLREALAANTIGGRVDVESRRRHIEQEGRQLQAAWTKIGFVPEPLARPLTERFRKVLRRSLEEPREDDRRDGRRRAHLPNT
jgi:hypothetical protein